MSNDMSDYSGPRVQSPRRINATSLYDDQSGGPFSRSGLARRDDVGDYSEMSDLYDALGYPRESELTWDVLLAKYLRNSIARTIVDKPAQDTWQKAPEIIDGGTDDTDEDSEFEQAVQRLLDGDGLRRSILHRWRVADQMCRLGEFSAIFFGFSDARDGSLEDEVSTGEFEEQRNAPEWEEENGLNGLAYVQVYHQGRTDPTIEDKNLASPRFGLPKSYTFHADEGRALNTVHHSRVIHVAEGTRTNDVRSESALYPVFNRLDDVEQLFGGSAEMYWQGAYPGLVVNPPTVQQPNGRERIAEFSDGGDGIHRQIQRYRETLERAIFPNGGEVKTLDPNIASPRDHVDVQLQAISAGTDPSIPKTMLIGNETGERSSTENRKRYHEGIKARRTNFAEPVIVRPTLNRLIRVGVLPEPQGDHYEIRWPTLEEPTQKELAERRRTEADAAKAAADAITVAPMIGNELLKRLGYDIDADVSTRSMVETGENTGPQTADGDPPQSPTEQEGQRREQRTAEGVESESGDQVTQNATDPMDAYEAHVNADD